MTLEGKRVTNRIGPVWPTDNSVKSLGLLKGDTTEQPVCLGVVPKARQHFCKKHTLLLTMVKGEGTVLSRKCSRICNKSELNKRVVEFSVT